MIQKLPWATPTSECNSTHHRIPAIPGEIPSKTQLGFVTFKPRRSTILATTRSRLWSKHPWIMGLPWCWLWIPVLYPTGATPDMGFREERWTWRKDEYDKVWYWDVMVPSTSFYDVLCWCIVSIAVLIVVGFLMFPRSLDLYLCCLIRFWDVCLRAASVSWGRNPLHNSYFNFQCWKLE